MDMPNFFLIFYPVQPCLLTMFGMCLLLFSGIGNAANFRLQTRASLIQQPDSQYFHYMRGVSGQISFLDQKIGVGASYDERPRFKSHGFEDQDKIYGLFLSTKLKTSKPWAKITGFAGPSFVEGYIKSTEYEDDYSQRSFFMKAISFAIQAEYEIKSIITAIGVINHTAFSSPDQTEIFVAWPYFGFYFSVGASI